MKERSEQHEKADRGLANKAATPHRKWAPDSGTYNTRGELELVHEQVAAVTRRVRLIGPDAEQRQTAEVTGVRSEA